MRKNWLTATVCGALLAGTVGVLPSSAADEGTEQTYVVVYNNPADPAGARSAIAAAGGRIVKENTAVGVATVASSNRGFETDVRATGSIIGASPATKVIGRLPGAPAPGQAAGTTTGRSRRDSVEKEGHGSGATGLDINTSPRANPGGGSNTASRSVQSTSSRSTGIGATGGVSTTDSPVVAPQPTPEPLAALQWDMAAIHATADGSYAVQRGDRRVLIGVMDTGVDGLHPDLAPNFSRELSRNFTTDIPEIDGPCEVPSCVDPADVDDDGHGTHVAGTMAAAVNGFGIAGIAPNATLVNIRAGQDSGYFFLQPTVDALTYAGDIGIDVVNMSFFVDPWLYNCASNPADSPAEQAEQRAIIVGVSRALRYARHRNVSLVAALGNEATDIGNPTVDEISPDYPADAAKSRTVDNSCLTMPTEGPGVIGVAALGPSGMLASFSNYGNEQNDVSAPGGFFRDTFGPSGKAGYGNLASNLTLSAYPGQLGAALALDPATGQPVNPAFVRACKGSVCGFYQYLHGTSMAAPPAAGVVALIVSEYGRLDGPGGRGDDAPDIGTPADAAAADTADVSVLAADPEGAANAENARVRPPRGLTLDPSRVERILYRTATKKPCPTPATVQYYRRLATGDLGPDFTRTCETGSGGKNSFYGNGVVDALAAVVRDH